MSVKEGNSINLSAELAAFPDDFPGFNAKWIRVIPFKRSRNVARDLIPGEHSLEIRQASEDCERNGEFSQR